MNDYLTRHNARRSRQNAQAERDAAAPKEPSYCNKCRAWGAYSVVIKDGLCQKCTGPSMKEISTMTPKELADAIMTVSPSQARKAAERYAQLKAARYVTDDGELIDPKDYDKLCDEEKEIVKRFIEQNGPLPMEGIGTFRLQDRSGQWSWDCIAMAENDRATFDRLLALGAITVNKKVADALEQAGQVTGFKGYGHAGSTKALIIDKDR